jgi:hypothetical protein
MADQPFLRRYELQVAYDTAFLFMNFRGLVGERWGHGPYFNAWGEQPGQVTFTSSATDQSLTGVVGIRVSSLIWHSPDTRDQAASLAENFLADCVEVVKPRTVRNIIVKQHHILPTTEAEELNGLLLADYPNLDGIIPPNYTESNSGLSFNATEIHGSVTRRATAVVGIYLPGMAQAHFGHVEDDEPETAFGAFTETRSEGELSLSEATQEISRCIRRADSDADHVLSKTLRKYARNA